MPIFRREARGMLTELSNKAKVVGAKQVRRALEAGRAVTVYLAADADPRVTEPIAGTCAQMGVKTETVPSMRELGKACGISVGAAVAATVTG